MRHEGRVAVITGAARGIGLAAVKRLAEGGARVVMLDRLDEVVAAASGLQAAGLQVEPVVLDLGQAEACQAAIDQVLARHGRLDILVNNAGIAPKQPDGLKALAENTTLEEWQRVLFVNLTSVFLLCRATAPAMRAQGWGRIVNLTSVAGRAKSDISGSAYCASKAGLIGFSRVLATELGGAGITVNCIAPGRIMTPLAAVAGEAVNQGYIRLIPVGRLGEPEDIAASISFLASDDAAFITGAVLDVNGGSYMA
jgi:3-oxoacyl-[acyl-carrier protein] reductase